MDKLRSTWSSFMEEEDEENVPTQRQSEADAQKIEIS